MKLKSKISSIHPFLASKRWLNFSKYCVLIFDIKIIGQHQCGPSSLYTPHTEDKHHFLHDSLSDDFSISSPCFLSL